MLRGDVNRRQPPLPLCLAVRRQGLALSWSEEGQLRQCSAPFALDGAMPGGERALVDARAALASLQVQLETEGAPGRAALHVVFELPWLMHMTVPWSAQLLRPDQASAYVRRCAAEAGWDLAQWDVRVDDAPYEQPRVATAYPLQWLAALPAWAQAQGWQLGRVTGLSVLAWELARQHEAAVSQLVVLGEQDTLFIAGGQRMESAHALMAPTPLSREEEVLRQWQRLRWRQPSWTGEARRLHGLVSRAAGQAIDRSDTGPLNWLEPCRDEGLPVLCWLRRRGRSRCALDWKSPRPNGTLLHAIAVAALLSVSAMALLDVGRMHARETSLAAQAVQLSRKPTGPSESGSKPQRAGEGVVEALGQLHAPYAELLAALLPPRDIEVALLNLEFGQTQGATALRPVKLQLEGRSAMDMTRYMAYLEDRKPLGPVVLTQHALLQDKAEERYRFTLEVAWRR